MKPKVFTIEEANQLLGQLSPLLTCLQDKRHEMMSMHDRLLTFELLQEDAENFYETEDGKEYLSQSSSLENLIISFEEDIKQVSNFGCVLRDIDRGVVDFYHVSNKELVFLNWILGEEEINFWHDLDSSFLERHPINQLA